MCKENDITRIDEEEDDDEAPEPTKSAHQVELEHLNHVINMKTEEITFLRSLVSALARSLSPTTLNEQTWSPAELFSDEEHARIVEEALQGAEIPEGLLPESGLKIPMPNVKPPESSLPTNIKKVPIPEESLWDQITVERLDSTYPAMMTSHVPFLEIRFGDFFKIENPHTGQMGHYYYKGKDTLLEYPDYASWRGAFKVLRNETRDQRTEDLRRSDPQVVRSKKMRLPTANIHVEHLLTVYGVGGINTEPKLFSELPVGAFYVHTPYGDISANYAKKEEDHVLYYPTREEWIVAFAADQDKKK